MEPQKKPTKQYSSGYIHSKTRRNTQPISLKPKQLLLNRIAQNIEIPTLDTIDPNEQHIIWLNERKE